MQSFADEVTVESPCGGVGPNRRNHCARGLLILLVCDCGTSLDLRLSLPSRWPPLTGTDSRSLRCASVCVYRFRGGDVCVCN